MRTSSRNFAVNAIESKSMKGILSTVAHYASAMGHISTKEGVQMLINSLHIDFFSFNGGNDIQAEAIETALTYMVNNFWQDREDNGYTMDEQEQEYYDDLLLMIKDEATAVFMAMDNYDYETWSPIWDKYKAEHRVTRFVFA